MLFFAIYTTAILSVGVLRLQGDLSKESKKDAEKSTQYFFVFMFLASFVIAAIVFTWLLYSATK